MNHLLRYLISSGLPTGAPLGSELSTWKTVVDPSGIRDPAGQAGLEHQARAAGGNLKRGW